MSSPALPRAKPHAVGPSNDAGSATATPRAQPATIARRSDENAAAEYAITAMLVQKLIAPTGRSSHAARPSTSETAETTSAMASGARRAAVTASTSSAITSTHTSGGGKTDQTRSSADASSRIAPAGTRSRPWIRLRVASSRFMDRL
jgi:hypothetical protein